jgi:lipopolysaccharide transport system ATP-binding protein
VSAPIIHVERLGKKYRILHQQQRHYRTLRDTVASGFRRIATPAALRARQASTEDFWALKDVTFSVDYGDVVGVVGRNGAGKSTLLKVLSRITEPTAGRVRLRGRVASLLEVGTGFHPELTGRENIFLNGAILGMSRAEITQKFDEIVAFAEVEPFLDTPVKRYSSGMYVRLAFAVAAHLEVDILVVDEVLAVGDAQFQKKCLGKMKETAKSGRTVFFVSHNLGAVGRLCTRGLLLDHGRLVADDDVASVVERYMQLGAERAAAHVTLTDYRDRSGDGTARITEASLLNEEDELSNTFEVGDSVTVEYRVEYAKQSANFAHSIELTNSDGVPIYHLVDSDSRFEQLPAADRRIVRARIPGLNLCPDTYYLTLWVGDSHGQRADRVADCLSLTIEDSGTTTGRRLHKSKGLIYKTADWSYR